jgi:hypothetical protein
MTLRIAALAYLAALVLPFAAYDQTAHAQRLPALEEARPDVQVFAMSTFVEQNCIGLRINKPMARDIFYRSGGYPEWKDNPIHQSLVREQVNTLRGDVPLNCTKLLNLYGPEGAIQPGIIELESTPPPLAPPPPPHK